ncbi:transcription initiation factor TFIID subunit 8 [Cajanus cajan]|nr:transcription initiation factor TFIID subunit 8 [Cajanus cajan]
MNMNPMQKNKSTKAASKLVRRAKTKKRKGIGANDAQVAETSSEFSFAIAKFAVAQICQSVGFKTTKYNALEALTNVSTRYLETIVRSAASFANASNRTDSNLSDLINGIHDLISVQGFPGGSLMHEGNLLRSSALKDIMNFADLSNKVPFAKPIPLRDVSEATIDSSTSTCFFNPEAKTHIPSWLPRFPKENCDQVLVKGRKCGEKLWEHSLSREENSGILQSNGFCGKEEKDTRMELPKKRERMKFKIRGEEEHIGLGVNMMNGVCKGRKRVSWNSHKIYCMVEGNEDGKR